jgi:hypothetical protein
MPGVASSAPAVLVGADRGRHLDDPGRLRRRHAANHAPLVVAEQFGTLEALHPGRIDLGLGRAPAPTRRPPRPCAAAPRPTTSRPSCSRCARSSAASGRTATRGRRCRPCPPSATARRSGCSAAAATAPSSPATSACRSPSPTTSRRRARCRRSSCTGAFRPVGGASTRRTPWSARRSCSPTPTSGRASWRCRRAVVPAAAQRPARAAAVGRGGAVLRLRPARAGLRRAAAWRSRRSAARDRAASLERLLDDTRADELMVTTMVHDPADRLQSFDALRSSRSGPGHVWRGRAVGRTTTHLGGGRAWGSSAAW